MNFTCEVFVIFIKESFFWEKYNPQTNSEVKINMFGFTLFDKPIFELSEISRKSDEFLSHR